MPTANADGTGVNNSVFNLPSGVGALGAVTLDYAYYVKCGSIGRVKLDGTGADNTFIAAGIDPTATTKMVIDGTTLYWMWSSQTESATGIYHIGKANLDGTGVDASYISGQQSTPARCGASSFSFTVTSGYAFVRFPVGTPGGMPNSCSLGSPSLGGVDRVSLSSKAVDTNYYSGAFGDQGLTASATNVFGLEGNGQMMASGNLYRANPTGAVDGSAWVTGTGGELWATGGKMAANASKVFFIDGSMSPLLKAVDATPSAGSLTTLATLTGMGMMMSGFTVQAPVNSGSASGGGRSSGSTPAPAPAPAQAATALKAPTQSTTADSNGNVAVTLALQLDEVGKYTFMFEKVTSNEMSREAASSSRISMQKGTKIGKRKLTKTVTAANVTTTSAGAKLVMRVLLKKAQAKKWNLRVIHTAADGAMTQSVVSK